MNIEVVKVPYNIQMTFNKRIPIFNNIFVDTKPININNKRFYSTNNENNIKNSLIFYKEPNNKLIKIDNSNPFIYNNSDEYDFYLDNPDNNLNNYFLTIILHILLLSFPF